MVPPLREQAHKIAPAAVALPWPLVVIDFEASALDQDSYPVEVGLARWCGSDTPILGWSVLIAPTADWVRKGRRSAKSARLHGITDEELRIRGVPPRTAADLLDSLVGDGTTAWCDGGDFDRYWLDRLYAAAGREPAFQLGDWLALTDRAGPEVRSRCAAEREERVVRHRARSDAEMLLATLACSVGLGRVSFGDLRPPRWGEGGS